MRRALSRSAAGERRIDCTLLALTGGREKRVRFGYDRIEPRRIWEGTPKWKGNLLHRMT